ncbi:MAG: MFS transporter [Deltaproteobacteria bacterium]|nr:MFS transporter [Deltaproteobacteria bacterium]
MSTAFVLSFARGFAAASIARALIVAGLEMAQVAIAWEIYAVTRDPLALGWIGLAQFLPVLLFSPVAGQVADRFPRRIVALLCLAGVVVGHLAFVVVARSLLPVLALLFLIGCLRAFLGPAVAALISTLIPADAVGRYAAANTMLFTVATILGPALGGLLLAALSPTAVYVAAVVVIVAAGLLLATVAAPVEARAPPAVRLSAALDGLSYLRGRPLLFASIGLDFVAVFLGGVTALLPIFAVDVLHTGATGLGVLRAAPAFGAALMGAYLTVRPLERRLGPALFLGVFVFGVATVVFGLSTSLPLSLAMLAVLGAADMVSMVVRSGLMQVLVPSEWRGRVSAVTSVFIGASNELGELESGVAAKLLGPVGAVVIGGVGCVLVATVAAVAVPDLRRLEALPRSPDDGR